MCVQVSNSYTAHTSQLSAIVFLKPGPLHIIGGSLGANVVLGNNSVVYDVGARFEHGAKFVQAEDTAGAEILGMVPRKVASPLPIDAAVVAAAAAETTALAQQELTALREKVGRLERLFDRIVPLLAHTLNESGAAAHSLDPSLAKLKSDDHEVVVVSVDSTRRRTPPLYGWSTEITVTDVGDMQLAATTALTAASIARYPGGTPADYMDWRTGWHWPNMTWSPHDGPWYNVPPRNAVPADWHKWTQAADIPFTCIDVCQLCNNSGQCCTLELELAGLREHARVGNDVTHVELGNEMYDTSRADVMRQYPQPSDYSDKMLAWVRSIKKEFPKAQVALVGMLANRQTWPQRARPGTRATVPPVSLCARNTSAACRQTNWNNQVMQSEAAKLADAATVHVYFPEYQHYNDSQMLDDPLSFEHFLSRAFTAAFDNAEYQALSIPSHLRIWVTEAGTGGSQRWIDALMLTTLDALFALSNRTDLVLPYGLNEGHDPAVESPLCPRLRGSPPCPHSAAGKTNARLTACGEAQTMLYAAARRAAKGSMAPLLFSHNPQLSPVENRSVVLVGFLFDSDRCTGCTGSSVEVLVINLGNATRRLDIRAALGVASTTQLRMTQLYAKSRADAVTSRLNASLLGRDTVSFSAGEAHLRPFSITALKIKTTGLR